MSEDLKKRVEPRYEAFKAGKIAILLSEEAAELVEELAEREAALVAGLKTIILTSDKISMIKTARATLKSLGINTNGDA